MKTIITLLLFVLCSGLSIAKTWKVGTSRTYKLPSQVATLVSQGDTVEIDAGVYSSDVAKWTANNLVIKGVGGLAHLKSNGNASGGKGIWVIAGHGVKIEYIEFSECAVPDHNGAGIRIEGKNISISYCYFHHNENGILAGTVNPSTIIIEYTEFGFNGYGDGLTHNLYINHVDTLIFRYNYSHHAMVGHELKSRANVNYILYNRLSDETNGTASRNIDLPNGGTSYIIGNIIEQGPQTQNSNLIGYGLEGFTNTSANEVYAINNTIINNRNGGSFFSFQAGTVLFKAFNNIIAGQGNFITGTVPSNLDTANNSIITTLSSFGFANSSNYDYHLTSSSKTCINNGKYPGTASSFKLNPTSEYLHSNKTMARCVSGILDIGAYEYCTLSQKETPFIFYRLYPNPSNGKLTIETPSSLNNTLEIYSVLGTLIGQYKLTKPQTEIQLNLEEGMYYYQINNQDKMVIKGKIILKY